MYVMKDKSVKQQLPVVLKYITICCKHLNHTTFCQLADLYV